MSLNEKTFPKEFPKLQRDRKFPLKIKLLWNIHRANDEAENFHGKFHSIDGKNIEINFPASQSKYFDFVIYIDFVTRSLAR